MQLFECPNEERLNVVSLHKHTPSKWLLKKQQRNILTLYKCLQQHQSFSTDKNKILLLTVKNVKHCCVVITKSKNNYEVTISPLPNSFSTNCPVSCSHKIQKHNEHSIWPNFQFQKTASCKYCSEHINDVAAIVTERLVCQQYQHLLRVCDDDTPPPQFQFLYRSMSIFFYRTVEMPSSPPQL